MGTDQSPSFTLDKFLLWMVNTDQIDLVHSNGGKQKIKKGHDGWNTP